MCHTPHHYSIKILTADLKEKLVTHYNEYIKWVENSHYDKHVKDDYVNKCNTIITYMYSEDKSEYIDAFVKITKQLDKIRNQDIVKVIPQYKDLFK
jgi:hypothetical protein